MFRASKREVRVRCEDDRPRLSRIVREENNCFLNFSRVLILPSVRNVGSSDSKLLGKVGDLCFKITLHRILFTVTDPAIFAILWLTPSGDEMQE